MNSLELAEYFQGKNQKQIFKGVYSSNNLPNSFTLPAAFIINLSPTNLPGTHWVVIFIDKQRHLEYFDSFGIYPQVPNILAFMKKQSRKITCTNQQLQHITSKNCGKFASVYVMFKLSEKSTSHFLNLFSKNLIINDRLIENYFMYFKKKN